MRANWDVNGRELGKEGGKEDIDALEPYETVLVEKDKGNLMVLVQDSPNASD